MIIRELTLQEVIRIFEGPMQQDFDPPEIKPLSQILYLWGKGVYPCFGFYEGDTLAAYAFLCAMPKDKGHLLLDYYAVTASMRGQGSGSLCLSLLQEKLREMGYDGVIAEVERISSEEYLPDSPDDWRARRIRFYERCGFRQTKVWCRLFGVDFLIMTMDIVSPLSDAQAMARMEALYHMMLTEETYRKNVSLFYADRAAEKRGKYDSDVIQ